MALAPLEAMASGRPVLLTDVPGARECLPPGERKSAVVPPEDAAALATRMAEALSDPIECERRGARLREHAAARHDVRSVVEQVDALYRDLLGAGPAAGRRRARVPQRI